MNQNQKMTTLLLPAEVIVHISKYLNIQDKLNLRLINKTFKFIFDNLIKLDCLTIISDEKSFNSNWFYTNRSNREIDLIKLKNKINLNKLFNKEFISGIKKLFFKHVLTRKSLNLDKTINRLKHLEELNLECKLNSNSKLSLPKLRILEIEYDSVVELKLETPLLSILRTDKLKELKFNYPEKIVYLELCEYFYLSYDIFEAFNNLNYLCISTYFLIEDFNNISTFLMKSNQLKELHLNGELDDGELNIYEDVELTKQLYKLKSKMNNLKIFLYGINFENLNNLKDEDPFLNSDCILNLILKFYSSTIDVLPFVSAINFDELNQFLYCNQDISIDDVVYKFPNIKKIEAYDLNDENFDYFLEFLSKWDNLNSLELSINQINYLDKLPPDTCKSIFKLDLKRFKIDNSTNSKFLCKFKNLSDLTLGKLNGVHNLKKLPDHLYTIYFKLVYRTHSFFISKNSFFGNNYAYDGKLFDQDRLIEHLDYLIDECNYTSNKEDSDEDMDDEDFDIKEIRDLI